MDANFQLSSAQDFEQSQCQNRILGVGSVQPPQLKSAYFFKSTTLANIVSDTQSTIDFLRLHVDEVMFNSSWGNATFAYNFGSFPTWNFSNGFRNSTVTLNNIQIVIPLGSAANGILDSAAQIQSGQPPTTPVIVCAFVTWVRYPNQSSSSAKTINRIVYNYGFTVELLLNSASIIADWYNGGHSTYPNAPFPPDQFEESINTIACPDDQDGPHSGQVLECVIPDCLGIKTIASEPFNIFGEFLQSQ